jgi:Rhodanese-like domain
MDFRRTGETFAGLAVAALLVAPAVLAAEQAPLAKAKDVKSCAVCHKPADGQMRAFFDSVAMKSQSIQLKLDAAAEVVKFDKSKLKVVNGVAPGDVEKSLRGIKKGHEVRVAYLEGASGIKTISEISIKPPMKVPAEKQLNTEAIEKLLKGTEKFTLVDARPPIRFQDGAIKNSINIPLPLFQGGKAADKLPQDKNQLLVFYCAGVT